MQFLGKWIELPCKQPPSRCLRTNPRVGFESGLGTHIHRDQGAVPGDPSLPFEDASMEAAAATWDPSAEYWKAGGGGTMWDFGPHWVDQVLDLVPGKVVGVFAQIRHVKWGDADDHFRIEMVFDNGTRAAAGKTEDANRKLELLIDDYAGTEAGALLLVREAGDGWLIQVDRPGLTGLQVRPAAQGRVSVAEYRLGAN